jgi:hypothetical protein
MKTSLRVKYRPAQTVYTVQCHDIITLTMPYGYPPGRAGFEHAEREDRPACWQLWCSKRGRDGCGWDEVLSEHPTKEEARAALLEARRKVRQGTGVGWDSRTGSASAAGTVLDAG